MTTTTSTLAGGTWTLGDRTVTRFGYGTMQLAGPGVMGPPTDHDGAIVEAMETLAELQQQGLIRHLGVSNVTAEQVSHAQEVAPLVCVQNLYNLAHRHDDPLIDRLAADRIAYVPFFPLGGFAPLQSEALSRVANRRGTTPKAVALAWLLQRSANILLIHGTSRVAHLQENITGAGLALSPEDVAELDGIGR
ncbi:aldo/keto reductase [Oerskovia flava]|uniref:aldo/keto reductase n=1 Tax=Oerskovia flava TaxID=2986422 RepID=UPI002240B32F|nr:aldo/keto reductase [Oerskovia sp. JB1-3-2]